MKWPTGTTVLLSIIAVLSVVSVAQARQLRCEISSKQYCTPAGCEGVSSKVWDLIDLEQKIFKRCDSIGCDQYAANITYSGVYIVIEVPGRGLIAKLRIVGGNFMEVATFATTAYVSFGVCR
jgi:hypothetical protein